MMTRLRAARDGQGLSAHTYTRLKINGKLWMADTDFECRTIRLMIIGAKGDVLVVGLGLGLILVPLLANKEVTSVTVLELSQDVIDLIGPYHKSPKLKLVQGDARTWKAPKKSFDFIYLDIWENVPNSDDKDDIKAIKLRFRSALKKGGKTKAWCEEMIDQ